MAKARKASAPSNKRCRLVYSTKLGAAYQGYAFAFLRSKRLRPGSVDLIFTSPPFALTRPKDYGNKQQSEYIAWFARFIDGFRRVLSPTGSLVVDIGGSYLPGKPHRSTYH